MPTDVIGHIGAGNEHPSYHEASFPLAASPAKGKNKAPSVNSVPLAKPRTLQRDKRAV